MRERERERERERRRRRDRSLGESRRERGWGSFSQQEVFRLEEPIVSGMTS